MSIKSKIKTLLWFLKHPKYYVQLLSLIKTKLTQKGKENTRQQAEEWCSVYAISTSEAIKRITGNDSIDIIHEYRDVFEQADKTISNLPVKMGGPGDINLLYNLCEGIEARKVIETGVAHGWSSLAILLSIGKREGAKLVSTDMPYAKMDNEDYVGCVVPERLRKNWRLLRLPDQTGLPKAFNQFVNLDLCHYDSDKSYKGRMWAYPKLWKHIRQGGIFVSDDIGDNLAFKDFVTELGIDPIIVKFKNQYIGILKKNE